jgi:hypothetical protein
MTSSPCYEAGKFCTLFFYLIMGKTMGKDRAAFAAAATERLSLRFPGCRARLGVAAWHLYQQKREGLPN